tara:strand:+ start:19143 stop:19469 length:327 start_codon:yes stop_codon:yes gene_type:complete
MKHLTILLSIYILALSFVTCSDAVASTLHDENVTEFAQDIDHGDHSHSQEVDFCSPFCSCQCCQVTVDVFPFHAYTLIPERNISDLISSFHNNISQEVFDSLYQPPIV